MSDGFRKIVHGDLKFDLVRYKGGVLEMLSTLVIGLDRNAPEANFNPELCTVSIIFRVDNLKLIKRKESYSSLYNISGIYICLR